MKNPKITVFTPTYNRAILISKVFESLQNQTFKDFEWLIVDDGSDDNTKEVVEKFQKSADFPIRYIYQKNGGKHRAINKGVKKAKGELFLIFDSDDECEDNAIEIFLNAWESIPKDKIDEFAGVVALAKYKNGMIVGNEFPYDNMISDMIEMSFFYNVKGDKWLMFKTDILKKFPFPEFEGEKFIAESSVWNEISRNYKLLFINIPLLIVEYQEDGLSIKSKKLRKENICGTLYVYFNQLKLKIPIKHKIKAFLNILRFGVFNMRIHRCLKKLKQ